jgi:carbamoyl-phosphate synthase large subunit
MDKPVILVSAIYGDIGSSTVRSLREEAKVIIGCDMKPYSPVINLLDKFYEVPAASDIENYISAIKKIIIQDKVDLFLPISEPEIGILNTRRKEIEGLGVKLLLNNQNIIDTFLDKLKTVQYLENMNIKVPKTMSLKDYDGSYGYPLIVKSRTSHGGKKLQKIEDIHDLDYACKKNDGSLLAQEYIGSDNEEYTTCAFSDGKKVSSITFRRKLGFGSMSIEAALADEPYIDNMVRSIAENIGLIGSINIQTRRVKENFIPFEINPRLSSTLLFRKRFGFDDATWWLNVLLGKKYSYEKLYKSGRAVRCLSECYFDMEEIGSKI